VKKALACARSLVPPVALAAAVCLVGAASSATAASTPAPPTPVSLTDCTGSLSPDSTGTSIGEPYLTDYRFSCDGNVTSYTVVVNRQAGDTGNVDDFNGSPVVFKADGVTPSLTESALCSATTPSDGINCNFGAGGALTASYFAVGSVDLIAPYCRSLPVKAKPGTPAVPQAIVELIVTDATGAQDGPFDLSLSKRCPRVPNTVPVIKKSKRVRAKHARAKQARVKHARAKQRGR
jgi:hypothetical protein